MDGLKTLPEGVEYLHEQSKFVRTGACREPEGSHQ